jgi:hypothetical protein
VFFDRGRCTLKSQKFAVEAIDQSLVSLLYTTFEVDYCIDITRNALYMYDYMCSCRQERIEKPWISIVLSYCGQNLRDEEETKSRTLKEEYIYSGMEMLIPPPRDPIGMESQQWLPVLFQWSVQYPLEYP